MRKSRIGCVAAVVVTLISCVFAVASASALEFSAASWLVGGNAVTSALSAQASGELLLEDTNALKLGIKAAVLCSGIEDGTVGPSGEGEITEELNLAGTGISSTALSGTSLSCTDESDCESAKVWPVGLPWKTLIEILGESGFSAFVVLYQKGGVGNPGWYVECTVLGVKASDECVANTESASEAENMPAGGVETVFSDAFVELAGLKLALCSSSGEETGIVEGSDEATTPGGGVLTASNEPVELVGAPPISFGRVSVKNQKSLRMQIKFDVFKEIKFENTLVKPKAGIFEIVPGSSTCVGVMKAGAECSVEVTYTPVLPAGTRSEEILELEYELVATGQKDLKDRYVVEGISEA